MVRCMVLFPDADRKELEVPPPAMSPFPRVAISLLMLYSRPLRLPILLVCPSFRLPEILRQLRGNSVVWDRAGFGQSSCGLRPFIDFLSLPFSFPLTVESRLRPEVLSLGFTSVAPLIPRMHWGGSDAISSRRPAPLQSPSLLSRCVVIRAFDLCSVSPPLRRPDFYLTPPRGPSLTPLFESGVMAGWHRPPFFSLTVGRK